MARKFNPLITAVSEHFGCSREAARQRILVSKKTPEQWWEFLDVKNTYFGKVDGEWKQLTKTEIDNLMRL